jgi:hypothetical protein
VFRADAWWATRTLHRHRCDSRVTSNKAIYGYLRRSAAGWLAEEEEGVVTARVSHHEVWISGVRIFYREAGPPGSSVKIVLLHGLPSSSHLFRHIIAPLALALIKPFIARLAAR